MPPIAPDEAAARLGSVPGWSLSAEGSRLRRGWIVRNFQAGVDFLNEVAALAEREGHHPDFQLAGYRNVTIELWTHAIGGLSENDFILAAKINTLPVTLPRGARLDAGQPQV